MELNTYDEPQKPTLQTRGKYKTSVLIFSFIYLLLYHFIITRVCNISILLNNSLNANETNRIHLKCTKTIDGQVFPD